MSHHPNKELRHKFEQVFYQSSGKIFNFVLSISFGNRYLAEEVTQTAFQKLWENLDASASTESMNSFLYTTAKNLMYNLNRHETVKWIYQNYVLQHYSEKEATTDMTVDGNFLLQYVKEVAAEMPPMRKKVFEMNKLMCYSTKEIAEQLKISVSTVETHLQLGLRYVRDELRKRYGVVIALTAMVATQLQTV